MTARPRAYVLGFGDSRNQQNRSAYIDDKHYAAIDSVAGTSVIQGFDDSGAPVRYERRSAQRHQNSSPKPAATAATSRSARIAISCNGALGARASISATPTARNYTDNIHLGWWVAGDVIDQSDLPTDMTASYEGHSIGNVTTNISAMAG